MYVAVYGTLRAGESNHSRLGGAKRLGDTFRLPGFRLYGVNFSFPYATPAEGESIVVELYEINDEILQELDWLEGYPSHYNRKVVNVGDVDAYVYFTNEVPDCLLPFSTGDWSLLEEEQKQAKCGVLRR